MFDGDRFSYVRCEGCRSLYTVPMPGPAQLAVMYGPSYDADVDAVATDAGKDASWVLAQLSRRPVGTFLDYGCGHGEVLARAAELGWSVVGVEFDEPAATRAAARSGQPVHAGGSPSVRSLVGRVDVVHLGDVIEHLVDPVDELGRILPLLRPGGLLLAQGPLEANPTLFLWLLLAARTIRRARDSSAPPYHVTHATRAGQTTLFQRVGLAQIEMAISEVDWPAPTRPRLANPRGSILWMVRRASRLLTRLAPNRLGNRYRFCGSVPNVNGPHPDQP